jgi:dnd system-associated protein 4
MQQPMAAPRIRRPSDDETFIKELTSEENAPFATIRDLLVFAAALAFNRGLPRRKFEKSAEPIPLQIFENASLDKFIDMLALVSSDDHNVLTDERLPERIAMFEEFAASGIEALRREMDVGNRSSLDVLRDLTLDQFKASKGAAETKLDHLISELEG